MRRAFTLIELLVVMSIIAVISTLILVGIGSLRRQAQALDTGQRMEAVCNALVQYNGGEGSVAESLQRRITSLGGAGQFASVYLIDSILKNTATGGGGGRASPPALNLTSASTNSGGETYFAIRDRVLDVRPPASGSVAAAWYETVWPFCWPETDWDRSVPGVVPPILRFPWGRQGLRLNGVTTDPAKAATVSDNGALNVWATYDRNGSGSGNRICHFSGSSTQTDVVGSPVTGFRSDGTPVSIAANKPLPFDAGWMSPLRTIDLLSIVGILDPITGAADYRNDRKTNRPWNDRWGNPLVVTYALFQPERYYSAQRYDALHDTVGTAIIGQDRRDLMLRAATEAYAFNRAIYLCAGSVGPVRRFDGDSGDSAPISAWDGDAPLGTWNAADDAKVLRALWRQVRSTARAHEWTEDSWSNPPWQGWRKIKGSASGEMCLVTAPMEVK